MDDKLQEIKNMVEAMDGDEFTAQLFGYEMDSQTVVEDLKWLVKQAEKAEKYRNMLKSIQRYTVVSNCTPTSLDSIHDYIKVSLFEIDNENNWWRK